MSENIKQSVLGTATLVMYELIQKIRRELPDTKYVYDEGLSYETAMKKFRDDNNMNSDDKVGLPLFAFRRSVLRYAEAMGGIGRRSTTKKAVYPLNNADLSPYISATILQAEFDVEFAYITREMTDLERFEVAYLSQRGIADGEMLEVDIPELPDTLKYQVDFKENLDDKTINVEDNYYKTIVGKFTVRGFFLVFKGDVKLITSIGLRIKTYEQELLENINIT
jgi:hypothetical protein